LKKNEKNVFSNYDYGHRVHSKLSCKLNFNKIYFILANKFGMYSSKTKRWHTTVNYNCRRYETILSW